MCKVTPQRVEQARAQLRKEIRSLRSRVLKLQASFREKQTELAHLGGDPYFYLDEPER